MYFLITANICQINFNYNKSKCRRQKLLKVNIIDTCETSIAIDLVYLMLCLIKYLLSGWANK